MRTTQHEISKVFEELCQVLNKKIGNTNIGDWIIDYYSYGGGYIIQQIENEKGGISYPLMNRRLPAAEFVSGMSMAIAAVKISQNN